jgi:hypothetical protein
MRARGVAGLFARGREFASLLYSGMLLTILAALISFCVLNIFPRAKHLLSIQHADEKFSELRQEIAKATANKRRLDKMVTESIAGVHSREAIEEYYGNLIKEAKAAGLRIVKFEEVGGKSEGEFESSNLTLELTGKYLSLVSFLEYLDGSSYPVSVGSLTASTPDGVSTELNCKIALRIYRESND